MSSVNTARLMFAAGALGAFAATTFTTGQTMAQLLVPCVTAFFGGLFAMTWELLK